MTPDLLAVKESAIAAAQIFDNRVVTISDDDLGVTTAYAIVLQPDVSIKAAPDYRLTVRMHLEHHTDGAAGKDDEVGVLSYPFRRHPGDSPCLRFASHSGRISAIPNIVHQDSILFIVAKQQACQHRLASNDANGAVVL